MTPKSVDRRSGGLLRRLTPLAVTLLALAVALSRIDLGGVAKTALRLPLHALLLVVLMLLAGSLLACLRLALVARDLHQPLGLREAVVAMSSGQLAGSFFFQIIGQTIARSAVLAKSGVSVSATIVITVYERIVAAIVSLVLALAGTLYLFGRLTLNLAGGGDQLVKILAGIAVVAATGAGFVWGGRLRPILGAILSRRNVLRYARASAITVAIQATTMAAYVLAAHGLSPAIPLSALMAATALVMLAASVPVSLAGWGLRELSAVYALGAIGMPYDASLVVALLIGSASLALTAGLALVSSSWRGETMVRPRPSAAAAPDYARFLSWFIPLFAASAVFFQLYLPVGAGALDVNLADSVVLFGGALFLLRLVARKEPQATSRLPGLGIFLILMSATIVLAFLHGLVVFGWTSWAFTNRLFGWLVLLAYAATGALLVLEDGQEGLGILLRTFIAAGLAIAAFSLAIAVLLSLGLPLPAAFQTYRIAGFAENPNAFAFQLLLVIAALIALGGEIRRPLPLLALAFAAIFYTASRAGEGTGVALCVAALAARFIAWRDLFRALLAAGVGVGVLLALSALEPTLLWLAEIARQVLSGVSLTNAVQSAAMHYKALRIGLSVQFQHGVSDAQRWTSVLAGFEMFLRHPLFGAGLGAFIEEQTKEYGRALVIHSTPVWLLAETGAAGFAVFAAPYATLLYRTVRRARDADTAGRLLLLSLVTFGVMSQVHELLYQRTLWLLLGAALVKRRA